MALPNRSFQLTVLPNKNKSSCMYSFSTTQKEPLKVSDFSFEKFCQFPEKETYTFSTFIISDLCDEVKCIGYSTTKLTALTSEILPYVYANWTPEEIKIQTKSSSLAESVVKASMDASFSSLHVIKASISNAIMDKFFKIQLAKNRLESVVFPWSYSTPTRDIVLRILLLREQFNNLALESRLKVNKDLFMKMYANWQQNPGKKTFRGLQLALHPVVYGNLGMKWLPPARDYMSIHHETQSAMFCCDIASFVENQQPISLILNDYPGEVFYKADILMITEKDDKKNFYASCKHHWQMVSANPLLENLPPELYEEYIDGSINVLGTVPHVFGRNFAKGE